ncbi:LRR and PYD domains-containing 3-like protein [Labeo rohita]|uniref:LRR and PYD domains-containing 3-like protein n=1 Tax=Labeo rohita TaxID=84645 RepID=A0A498MN66_LABRO|nr:LRR and PYD domains-containing 3-like protein [Labeo rohita]
MKRQYRTSVIDRSKSVKEYTLPSEHVNLAANYTEPVIIQKSKEQNEKYYRKWVRSVHTFGEQKSSPLLSNDRNQSIRIDQLFSPDCDGNTPESVILSGDSGRGKSFLLQKIMLDWASGELYSENFDAVFLLKCDELKSISTKKSLFELLSLNHSLTSNQISQILQLTPEKVLILIDGFDDYVSRPPIHFIQHTNPSQKASLIIILTNLLRGVLLPESFMLVTTRSAVDTVNLLKGPQRFTEIVGFSERGVQEYFQTFFKNKQLFRRAYDSVKTNESLLAVCSVPLLCWMVCFCLKKHLKDDDHVMRELKTTTSIYVHFVSTLLEHHDQSQSVLTMLRSLGQLAEEGMKKQQVFLDETSVTMKYFDATTLFLYKDRLKIKDNQKPVFRFMNPSFQEFFTALYYVLLDEEKSWWKFSELLDWMEWGDIIDRPSPESRSNPIPSVLLFFCGLLSETSVGLKTLDLKLVSLNESWASGIIFLAQTCTSLQELRWKCSKPTGQCKEQDWSHSCNEKVEIHLKPKVLEKLEELAERSHEEEEQKPSKETQFVDGNYAALIQRVTLVKAIADELKNKGWSDIILKYKASVIDKCKFVTECNLPSVERVELAGRYTKPVIIQKSKAQTEKYYREHVRSAHATGSKPLSQLISNDKNQSIRIDQLFSPDSDGHKPKYVILKGDSGRGKSLMLQKIMLDWASGKFYSENLLHLLHFDVIFLLKCDEVKCLSQKMSLNELLSWSCSLTSDQISQILELTPQKVIILIDGIDEYVSHPPSHSMLQLTNPSDRAQPMDILRSVLKGILLPESFMLVTTRSIAADALMNLLKGPQRFTEIMGFSERGVQEYFQKFFQDEKLFRRTFESVKTNESLLTACSVPLLCWMVCFCLKKHFTDDDHVMRELKTTTSIYVHFVSTLLEHHDQSQSVVTVLRSLGQLAEEGMKKQQIFFDEESVAKSGLDPATTLFFYEAENLKILQPALCMCEILRLSVEHLSDIGDLVRSIGESKILRAVRVKEDEYSAESPRWSLDLSVTHGDVLLSLSSSEKNASFPAVLNISFKCLQSDISSTDWTLFLNRLSKAGKVADKPSALDEHVSSLLSSFHPVGLTKLSLKLFSLNKSWASWIISFVQSCTSLQQLSVSVTELLLEEGLMLLEKSLTDPHCTVIIEGWKWKERALCLSYEEVKIHFKPKELDKLSSKSTDQCTENNCSHCCNEKVEGLFTPEELDELEK